MQGLSSETQTSHKKHNEIMFMCWNVSSFRNLALGLCLNMQFIQIIPRCHSLSSQGSELMHGQVTQTDVHTAGTACSHRLCISPAVPRAGEVLSEVLSPPRSLQSWGWLQVPLKNHLIALIITKVLLPGFAAVSSEM